MEKCKPIKFNPLEDCKNCFEPIRYFYYNLEKMELYSDNKGNTKIGILKFVNNEYVFIPDQITPYKTETFVCKSGK